MARKADTLMVDGKELKTSLFRADLVRDHRLVEKTWKKREAFLKAKRDYERFLFEEVEPRLRELNEGLPDDGKVKQVSITDIGKSKKIVVVHRDYVTLTDRALTAKTLINQVVDEMKGKTGDGDGAALITLLAGLFVGGKGLSVNKNLILFMNGMTFEDERLKKAQELLKEAICADQSRQYVNLFEKDERGKWESAESV